MARIHRRTVHYDPDNHDGVITHLEPDILECEVKWALKSITTNKASRGDGILAELFQILKDDAVKVLHSICQQIWKAWQPTPVFLPGESHGRRSLVEYNPWGCKESDTTERLHFHFYFLSTGIPSPPLALFVVMLSKAHLTSHSRMSGSR